MERRVSCGSRSVLRHTMLTVCLLCAFLTLGGVVIGENVDPLVTSDSNPSSVISVRDGLVRRARSLDRTVGDGLGHLRDLEGLGLNSESENSIEVTPSAEVAPRVAPVSRDFQELSNEVIGEVASEVPHEVAQSSTKVVQSEVTSQRGGQGSFEEARPVPDLLRHVFIAVKTSGQFHGTRLPPILDTWFTTAPNQTWFFSDIDDAELQQRTGGHVINTNCSPSHRREALCCKMAVEYDTFMASGKKWFCHFDDDNYVNVVRLSELLSGYSPQQDWYLGKNSIRAPLQILDRDRPGERVSFWFATGGAGFCLSRALALKMAPIASGGRFMRVGDKIRLPDDVTVGYIVEHLLKVPLSVVDQFHSHLEQMKFIRTDQLSKQISFSYSQYPDEANVVSLDTLDSQRDPTRFYSLHCLIHPNATFCPS
ncbi:fringe glycosyltransferase-like [Amphibalanus amphitrite]|uniref:fringe glycosyltransferase-like n=1 Tax=Amphibalanus amphitrite TaxID=1232801 RepID=UPI001C9175F0|nr:fringe glycosyltransferase-like [Amphibalanus amphitrite]